MKKTTTLNFKRQFLTVTISALLTNMVATSVGQASDLAIYSFPNGENKPIIMLALDNSSSMNSNSDATYKQQTVTRMAALRGSLVDALEKKDDDGNYIIPPKTYVGISTFTSSAPVATDSVTSNQGNRLAKISVPAEQLTDAHRTRLINFVKSTTELPATASTPTPLLFAETFAYLKGTSTKGVNNLLTLNNDEKSSYSNYSPSITGMSLAPSGTVVNNKYIAPLSKLSDDDKQCSTQGVFFLTDGAPVGIRPATTLPIFRNVLEDNTFICNSADIEPVYYNFDSSSVKAAATYNGEYGQMALKSYLKADQIDETGTLKKFEDRSSWQCVASLVEQAANATERTINPKNKRIYTATVGFGGLFTRNSQETCRQNADGKNIFCSVPDKATDTKLTNVLNAEALMVLGNKVGKGPTFNTNDEIGGYTFATSGESLVLALESFVGDLDKGNFSATSFGNYIVPDDPLAAGTGYDGVYAPQFTPALSASGSTQKTWAGNLKKYSLGSTGSIIDKNNTRVLNAKGLAIQGTTDLWNTGTGDGGSVISGGFLSKMRTPTEFSTATAYDQFTVRKLFSNSRIVDSGSNKTLNENNTLNNNLLGLSTEKVVSLTQPETGKTGWQTNTFQPYLLTALGFNLNPSKLAALTNAGTFSLNDLKVIGSGVAQAGAVLHSDPILVTPEVEYDENGDIVASKRKDLTIFGSLQGMLHVVNAKSGTEEMAFIPFEILNSNKKENLLHQDMLPQLSDKSLNYGIDGKWTSFVEYGVPTAVTGGGFKLSADTVNIYGGMRMGGTSYYGLDIKNTAQPKILFRVGPDSGKDTTLVADMGQSWSKPVITKIRYNNQIKQVMIVGGGYDIGYESPAYVSDSNTKGRGVYIFDAKNGNLIWSVQNSSVNNAAILKSTLLKDSVVSEIQTADRDGDGLTDHLYFGDLGGKVFRVDLNNTRGTPVANFGSITNLADFSAVKQRFYERPSFSIHSDAAGRFAVIGIGSGDRSSPVTNQQFNQRMYGLIDRDVTRTDLYNSAFRGLNARTEANLISRNETSYDAAPLKAAYFTLGANGQYQNVANARYGWYYNFNKTINNANATVGSLKVLNDYYVGRRIDGLSDLVISVYDPNGGGTSTADPCKIDTKGETLGTRFCLPYADCDIVQSTMNKGIGQINVYSNSGKERIVCIGDVCGSGKDDDPTQGTGGKGGIIPLGGWDGSKGLRLLRWYERR